MKVGAIVSEMSTRIELLDTVVYMPHSIRH